MSCETKFREYNDMLAAETNLAAGSVDAAPRCIKCDRPLLRDGRCVMGHAQNGTESAPAAPPVLDALRCATQQVIADGTETQWIPVGGGARVGRSTLQSDDSTLLALQDILQPDQALTPETLGQAMQLFDALVHRAYERGDPRQEEWEQDPRITAARTAAVDHLLAQAEDLLAQQDDAQSLSTAWTALEQAYDWAQQCQDQGRAEAARTGMQRIIPLGRNDWLNGIQQAQWLLAAYLRERTGLTFRCANALPQGFYLEPTGNSANTSFYRLPRKFNEEALRQLREVLGLEPQENFCLLDIAQASARLHQIVGRAQTAWDNLATTWQSFQRALETQPNDPNHQVQVIRQHGIPLWQQTWDISQDNLTSRLSDELRPHGPPPKTMQEEVLQALGELPPHLLPQALADLHFEPRVIKLLRFKGVREAIFAPADEDVLQNLPHLAPATMAGLRACELLEGLQTEVGQRDLYQTDLSTLIEAGQLMEQASDATGSSIPPRNFFAATARVLDGLSAHLPPDRAPIRFPQHPGYLPRLSQAVGLLDGFWSRVDKDSERFPTKLLRERAAAAGMSYGQYAYRKHLSPWLRAATRPEDRQRAQESAQRALVGKNRGDICGIDRTGGENTYKRRDTIRTDWGGFSWEARVATCMFLADEDPQGRFQGLKLAVRVFVPDDVRSAHPDMPHYMDLPLTEVELVPKRKGKKSN